MDRNFFKELRDRDDAAIVISVMTGKPKRYGDRMVAKFSAMAASKTFTWRVFFAEYKRRKLRKCNADTRT